MYARLAIWFSVCEQHRDVPPLLKNDSAFNPVAADREFLLQKE